jgi:predicted transposase YbfD/YdcC
VDKFVDMASITAHFETLEDPRHTRNRKHLLVEVIVLCVAGILCGCDGPTAIHRWAKERQDWLRQHLPLANGIPSRDCIRRVLIALKPEAFQKCFQTWIADAVLPVAPDPNAVPIKRLIAVDGKTCRGSHEAGKTLGALHIVSAWASEEGIALGQVATEAKSNEIAAIPELLQQIELKDTIITIDAMGCQKEIVTQIVQGGGDCVIAVKKNQPKLEKAIADVFYEAIKNDLEDREYRCQESHDEGHGRTDERIYFLARVPKDFAPAQDWPEVKAIGYALRYTRHDDGEETVAVRYYISTRYWSGKRFAEAVRGHWAIESMHWVLDVTFREDAHRTRERNMADNLSWLRRFAVSLLKRHPGKDSIKGKMLRCGYNPDFLAEILQIPAD